MRVLVPLALAASLLGAPGCQTVEPPPAAGIAPSLPKAVARAPKAAPAPVAPAPSVAAAPVAPAATPGTILSKTILPEAFARELPAGENPGTITVPGEMLRVSAVARPRAEVRSGPGAQFDLEEFVLEQGDPVVLFDRIGVWQKVLAIGTWKKGWVHAATLAAPEARKDALTLETRLLPTVLAMHPIDAAKRYPEGTAINVVIPKGAMFRSLMFNGAAALVMLPETNSVMWVSRKDVK